MSMPSQTLLSRIKELSEVDTAILRIVSERKKLQKEFESLNTQIEALRKEVASLQLRSAEVKSTYEKETKKVKYERETLAARRRALATLGNYKLQQAAAKEIDTAEHALSAHEDTLLGLLDGSELSEKSAGEKELLLLEKEEQRAELVKDMKPTLDTLAEREAKHADARAALLAAIDPKDLAIYEGIKNKLAPDTLSPIVSGACDFCNLQTPPQMVIIVTAGNTLQKCRGCSRILYVPAGE